MGKFQSQCAIKTLPANHSSRSDLVMQMGANTRRNLVKYIAWSNGIIEDLNRTRMTRMTRIFTDFFMMLRVELSKADVKSHKIREDIQNKCLCLLLYIIHPRHPCSMKMISSPTSVPRGTTLPNRAGKTRSPQPIPVPGQFRPGCGPGRRSLRRSG